MKKKKVTQIVKTLCVFFSLVFFSLNTIAQSPAANISGPLKAKANSSNIIISCQIALGTQNPDLTYTFQNNTSGASIVSQGPYVYDALTETGTQDIVINPGSSVGSFVITLEVRTPLGRSKCSKSVVVSNNSYGSSLQDTQ